MKNLKSKLTSRKFIAALSGVAIGLGVIVGGDTTEGIVTVILSVVGYLTAEGYIDAKAVKTAAQTTADVANGVREGAESHDQLL